MLPSQGMCTSSRGAGETVYGFDGMDYVYIPAHPALLRGLSHTCVKAMLYDRPCSWYQQSILLVCIYFTVTMTNYIFVVKYEVHDAYSTIIGALRKSG